ncbi:Fur family transcriptional regulator, ferric uptake regulator [Pedobacter westerhofensis]|uniref:Fur family transcriptional regulator, ferric uptake regulator n=2 Tax=Pedobacter westerhofensis TaxID=425512 RepID=A0A521BL96_9SPHI|nr:Fur family transcriptional regulator, ferric uptake regulator [Pedobacter westerhofensis]
MPIYSTTFFIFTSTARQAKEIMIKEAEDILVHKEISPTAMRLLVLRFLLNQASAISLTELEKGLGPSDRVTIYRVLKKFEEKGLVHSIDDGSGAPKYALCAEDCVAGHHHDLHVHFFCNACRETSCLPKSKIPQVTLPEGFASEEVNLMVKGTCSKCIA